MDETLKKIQSNTFIIYLLGFLFTLQATLPAYITSTFLSRFVGEKSVGVLYALSSVLAIAIFCFMPRILRKFGNYKIILSLLVLEFFSLIGLTYIHSFSFLGFSFIAFFVTGAVIGFTFDVFLEHFSNDSATGKIRGLFMTSVNAAWIVSPLLGGVILTNGDYWKIFITSAVLIIPVFLLIKRNLKNFKDPEYKAVPLLQTIRRVWSDKNIWSISMSSLLLNFFYGWMVIYMPIYLHEHIGFSWGEIGVMFSIMLMPFVLTEAPLGKLADSRFGEKEILSIGFIIMAVTSALTAFISVKNFTLWAAVLFLSRVGASMVEIMSETYFFKKVRDVDVHIISAFRTIRPWSYVVSPILAIILFGLGFDLKNIFVALGFVMLVGLYYSLAITDTK